MHCGSRHLHLTASRAILTSQDSIAGDVHNETVLKAFKKPGMSTVHLKIFKSKVFNDF